MRARGVVHTRGRGYQQTASVAAQRREAQADGGTAGGSAPRPSSSPHNACNGALLAELGRPMDAGGTPERSSRREGTVPNCSAHGLVTSHRRPKH